LKKTTKLLQPENLNQLVITVTLKKKTWSPLVERELSLDKGRTFGPLQRFRIKLTVKFGHETMKKTLSVFSLWFCCYFFVSKTGLENLQQRINTNGVNS
jgi:hypothetical protein